MGSYGQQIINTVPILSPEEIEEEDKGRQVVTKKKDLLVDNEPMKPLFIVPNMQQVVQ